MRRHYSGVVARPVRDLIFPQRIRRKEYFLRSLILVGALWVLPVSILNTAITEGGLDWNIGIGILLVLFVLQIVLTLGGVIRPRLRDIGWSRAWAWLAVLPVVNGLFWLVLLAVEGRRD